MYSINKIKPCKLYESQIQNLVSFTEGKDFDDYIDRQRFLQIVENYIIIMEQKYYVDFSEKKDGSIEIILNNRPIP